MPLLRTKSWLLLGAGSKIDRSCGSGSTRKPRHPGQHKLLQEGPGTACKEPTENNMQEHKYEFGFQWPPTQGAKQKPLPREMFIRGEGKAVTSDPTHSRGWESQVPKVEGLTATPCRSRVVLGRGKPCNSITWQQVQDLTLSGCPAGSQSQNDYNFRKKHRAWSRILLCSQGGNKTPCHGHCRMEKSL